MYTQCGTMLRTSSNRIRNHADKRWTDWNGWKFSTFPCRATAHSYGARCNTATETTFTLITTNDANQLLFFHVQPANQPTITGMVLAFKKFGRPWFTETRVVRYQPFELVHNAPLHSECHTINKCDNKKKVKLTAFTLRICDLLLNSAVTDRSTWRRASDQSR
jgi:hypothetical protein